MTDSPAIRHSLMRLDKAREALKRLEAAKTLDEADSAWLDLLLAGNGVYSKLEQGSKCNGKATAWFGRAKKSRKDDPLLSYMHHARNSDEHGIEDITKRVKAGDAQITIREPFDPKKLEGVQLSIGTDIFGNVRVTSSNESVVSTRMFPEPSLTLTAVKDPRFNDEFNVPCQHLGVDIKDQSPSSIGKLFIDYISFLVDEARNFGI
jgi:hypothetical protein